MQVNEGLFEYLSVSMIPMIVLMSEILALIVFSIVLLVVETFNSTAYVWYRESFGLLIQKLILTCCLIA
jgi:hypothetical protein